MADGGVRGGAREPADLEGRERLPAPGLLGGARVASPTRSPWIVANGWRFLRRAGGRYACDLPAGKAALAAAEAFAYGADALLRVDPADLEDLGRMLALFRLLPAVELPGIADLGIVDDGSPLAGEVMNLLSRRNLLFRAVPAPAPELAINVRLGAKEYPREDAADPSAFALKLRRQLTDERRALRIYGSEVVVGRLTGEGGRVRLHLLNYGGRELEGLRVRLRGVHREGEAFVAGRGRVALEDQAVAEEATEFSLPSIGAYAVVDLPPAR